MIIRTQKSLRQAINEKIQTITDSELFSSNSYKDFLNSMISGVTKRYGQPVILDIVSETEDSTAYTDGNRIHINFNNKIINKLERKDKNTAIIASVLHECGHILFTDFKLSSAVNKKLSKENFLYPQPKQDDLVDAFNIWLITNNAGDTLLPLYHFLDNSIEDGYVDKRIISCIPGYGQCRTWYKQVMAMEIPSYKSMKDDTNMDNITILLNLILSYAKFGIINFQKDIYENDELIKKFYEVKLLIDKAINEYNSVERKRIVNEIFIHIYSIIAADMQQQNTEFSNSSTDSSSSSNQGAQANSESSSANQTGNNNCNNSSSSQDENQSNDNSGNGSPQNSQNNAYNGSESNLEQISQNGTPSPNQGSHGLQSTTDIMKNLDKNKLEHLLNNMSSVINKGKDNNHKNTDKLKQPDNTTVANNGNINSVAENSDKSAQNLIDQLIKQAAEEKIAEKQETEIESELNQHLKQISKNGDYHHNVCSSMERVKVSEHAKYLYDVLHTDLDHIAKRLAKNLQKDIKDRQIGDTMNGLYMGKRLDNRSLYRKDKKIFTKKIQPENIPDMEISVLIDQSGSMKGERIDTCMKATYIFYSFCNLLQIPISVFGHHVNDSKVKMHSYTDGISLDGQDRIRIFDMKAGGCNRDGYALRFCLNRLKESNASIRLMMIISDGRPNATNYGLEEGKADIQEAVADARKEGIITIAAAIGDDTDEIRYIYNDGISEKKSAIFLDITDLERLPKVFPQIVKRYLQ